LPVLVGIAVQHLFLFSNSTQCIYCIIGNDVVNDIYTSGDVWFKTTSFRMMQNIYLTISDLRRILNASLTMEH